MLSKERLHGLTRGSNAICLFAGKLGRELARGGKAYKFTGNRKVF